MNVFELFGKIVVDASGATSGIDKTVGHAQNAENKLAKTFKKIGGMVAAAFSVRAIVDFGKQCTQAYATIAAEEAAFTQIMGDYADTAQAKLTAVADSTGVVSTRLTSSMTSLTAKFKGLGYGVEDATTLAADGLLIATDAAAFWDMSLEESMSHLNSFINGSYEGGEAIGLFANDTQMAAYAIEKGIVADTKAWTALDEATKQATRLDYAKNMQAQSGATGQAAKESQSYANVMANLKERWRQFQGVVGKPILEKFVLPAMQKLNDFMPVLTEAVTNGIDWLSEGFDKIASYFTDVFTEDGINMDALPDALSKMFRDLGGAIPGLLATVGQAIKGAWTNAVWPMIQGLFKAVFGVDLPDWGNIGTAISDGWSGTVWPAIQNFFKSTFGIELPSWDDTVTAITNGWTTVKNGISGFFKAVFGLITGDKDEDGVSYVDKLKNWFTGILAAIGNFWCAVFGLKTSDTDENGTSFADKLKNWFTGVLAAIGDFWCAVFGLKTSDTDEEGTTYADVLKGWFEGVLSAAGDVFNVIVNVVGGLVSKARNTLTSWWNNVKSGLSFTVSPTVTAPPKYNPADALAGGGSSAAHISGGVMGAQAYAFGFDSALMDKIPGFATGLDYVPRDNFLARLHQGEAVLTRDEADAWRGGSGRVESVLAQMANLLQDIAQNTGADRQMVLDTGALVGQLTPGIDARLGTISNRKGRGNA